MVSCIFLSAVNSVLTNEHSQLFPKSSSSAVCSLTNDHTNHRFYTLFWCIFSFCVGILGSVVIREPCRLNRLFLAALSSGTCGGRNIDGKDFYSFHSISDPSRRVCAIFFFFSFGGLFRLFVYLFSPSDASFNHSPSVAGAIPKHLAIYRRKKAFRECIVN